MAQTEKNPQQETDPDSQKQPAFPAFRGPLLAGDKALWITIAFLAAFSLLVVYSATASLAWKKGDSSYFLGNQLTFLFIAFWAIYFVHRGSYQLYYHLTPFVYIISLLVMAATFFLGVNLNDAQRWLKIPIVGVTMQPSDFLRITTVMILARRLAIRQSRIEKMKLLPRLLHWGGKHTRQNREIILSDTIPLLLPVALSCGMIFFSNLSTAIITFVTCLVMLFIGRVRIRELLRLLGVAAVVVVMAVSIMYAYDMGRSRTWVHRMASFIPGIELKEENGKSVAKDLYQVRQAEIAISTGGLIGKGPGNSTQRANLPHSYSDFAYAFVVEEYGTVVAAAMVLLYLWIFFRSTHIFRRCGTAFPALLVLGLGLMIVLQAIVNMLVSVHLMPVTGQTLPLVSLGGSSLVFTAIALGMMLAVSRQVQENTLDKPKEESILER